MRVPDGAGKSTVCLNLQQNGIVNKVLPSPRLAAKGNAERMRYETTRYLKLHGRDNRIAVDRLLFSEMAYGPILRGRSTFSRSEYLFKLLEIQASGSFVIFCLPEVLNYKADESPVVIEKMPLIRPLYEKMYTDFRHIYPRCYKYEWDKPNAFNDLKKFLQEM